MSKRNFLRKISGSLVFAGFALTAGMALAQMPADVVSASSLKRIVTVAPVYPPEARANRVEGWVEVGFTVTPTGEVAGAQVRAASPAGIFDEAALAALSQWRFQPVMKDGKPVSQRSVVRLKFMATPLSAAAAPAK
jgi:TonB family protein